MNETIKMPIQCCSICAIELQTWLESKIKKTNDAMANQTIRAIIGELKDNE